jgi:murein DD-endopeptidase MepM/ murein hydrolase activator NlpD
MAAKKYHTLIIMSSTPGKSIIRLSLPTFCWRLLSVMMGAVLFWAGVGTWSVFHHNQISQQSQLLERENRLVNSELEVQKRKAGYLNNELLSIREQAVFIQNYLGLNSEGIVEGKIGQGGEEVSLPAFSLTSDLTSQVNPTAPELRDLSQTVYFSPEEINQLDTDLHQIIKTLQDRQEKIECTPSISPVDPQRSWISCSYGMRVSPFTDRKEFHPGIDIAGWKGIPILATAKGKVTFQGNWGSMGMTVRIRHDSTFTTTYGHLLKSGVRKGQYVKRGEIIGYMGNSGMSTGYHLHYEVKKYRKRVNPFNYMMDLGKNNLLLAAGEKQRDMN